MGSINLLLAAAICAAPETSFVDMADGVGLGPEEIPETVSRLCLADLNADGFADAVIDRHRVFLNQPDESSPIGRRFVEVPGDQTGLLEPVRGTVRVFADLDNDGYLDAITAEYIDKHNESWEDHGQRTRWQKGNGDGTFGEDRPIEQAMEATTCAIAVGDVDGNGRLDLWLGNWYVQYGATYAGHRNDLLRQVPPEMRLLLGGSAWVHQALPDLELRRSWWDRDDPADEFFPEHADNFGRPTYGAMIAHVLEGQRPQLIELNYGRRWNRAYEWRRAEGSMTDGAWVDCADATGLDGDAIRHGRYPDWAVQRMAQRDPPIELEPEQEFRANGNTFDCAVGDIDNDGDFDLFLAAITHGWAGESSDRSRFMLNPTIGGSGVRFTEDAKLIVDRIPPDKDNWNQGDLFCALADLDHDTRLDLILSSGDYPDNQRLRIYLQQPDGSMKDATAKLGIDHDGSHQLSLADVDGDGDLDILAGQTFFRYSAEQKAGRKPHPVLLINEATGGRKSLVLKLRGDGERVNRDALGAIVRATLPDGTVMSRQLVGVGGHAGKQMDFIVHFGLGEHDHVTSLHIQWPGQTVDGKPLERTLENVDAGLHVIEVGEEEGS